MELQCQKCKYQFNSEKIPLMCPFCGSERSVRTVPSAADLLKEAEVQEEKLKEIEKRKEEWKNRLNKNQ